MLDVEPRLFNELFLISNALFSDGLRSIGFMLLLQVEDIV